MRNGQNFSVVKTFFLGFGFLGVSIIWSLYNAYVPVFLKESFNLKSSVIGFVMTIDNIFAVLLLPFLGALSDRTKSPLGRRRPYILAGAPFAALFFILIPYATGFQSIVLMMSVIIMMNLAMAFFRSPVIALMPDITPSRYRSQANGIINFMGGFGALLVYFGGKPLYDKEISYPFIAGGILMLLSCLLVVFVIKEDRFSSCSGQEQQDKPQRFLFTGSFNELFSNFKEIFSGDKSLLFILIAIFFWFTGFNAIETFFTSYARFYLGMKESTGAVILGFFSLAFMLSAILSGIFGAKIGRNNTIKAGLLILFLIMIAALFIKSFWLLVILFVIAGFGWALINVNSLPMVVDMTSLEKAGGYTGLYYFFSQAANIAAPPLAGTLIDIKGYPSLMVFSSSLFLISGLIMLFVKRGEADV